MTEVCQRGHQYDPMVRKRRECPECDRARVNAWANANREKKRACDRAWAAANREKKLVSKRAWRQANPEKQRMGRRAWKKANPERHRAMRRVWAQANPEKVKAWREANREKDRATKKAWANANRAKRKAGIQTRRARKRGAPTVLYTPAQKHAAFAPYKGLCAHCGTAPATAIDHIIPLRPGHHALYNLAPTCSSCNSSKKRRVWMPRLCHSAMIDAWNAVILREASIFGDTQMPLDYVLEFAVTPAWK